MFWGESKEGRKILLFWPLKAIEGRVERPCYMPVVMTSQSFKLLLRKWEEGEGTWVVRCMW